MDRKHNGLVIMVVIIFATDIALGVGVAIQLFVPLFSSDHVSSHFSARFREAVDFDGDGIPNSWDNCIWTSNLNQRDSNGDGRGDACINDTDGDTVLNALDNCPTDFNPSQDDQDGDGIGDECDPYPCGNLEDNNAGSTDDRGMDYTFTPELSGGPIPPDIFHWQLSLQCWGDDDGYSPVHDILHSYGEPGSPQTLRFCDVRNPNLNMCWVTPRWLRF